MPSMTMLTLLPGFIEPTPKEVPQAITSPGSRGQSHARAGGLRAAEHVARMNLDAAAFDRAEAGLALMLKAYPMRHSLLH